MEPQYNPEKSKGVIGEIVTKFLETNPRNSSTTQEVIGLFNGEDDDRHHVASIFTGDRYLMLEGEYTLTGMAIPEIRAVIEGLERLGFEHNHT